MTSPTAPPAFPRSHCPRRAPKSGRKGAASLHGSGRTGGAGDFSPPPSYDNANLPVCAAVVKSLGGEFAVLQIDAEYTTASAGVHSARGCPFKELLEVVVDELSPLVAPS